MAALNFPVNPAVDDTFIANNVIYTWTGVYWEANTNNGFDARYVNVTGDNMTGSLTLGTDKITLNAADGLIRGNKLNIGDQLDLSYLARVVRTDDNDLPNLTIGDGRTASAQKTRLIVTPSDDGVTFEANNTSQTGRSLLIPLESGHSVKLGGTLPSAPNITLNADGSIIAAGNIKTPKNILAGVDNGTDPLSVIYQSGRFYARAANTTDEVFRIEKSGGITPTILFKANGSATFAGNVSTTSTLLSIGNTTSSQAVLKLQTAEARLEIYQNDTLDFLGLYNRTDGAYRNAFTYDGKFLVGNSVNTAAGTKITLFPNGSAEYKGDATYYNFDLSSTTNYGVKIQNGLVSVQRGSGNADSSFISYQGNVPTANIVADGSATFAGTATIGSTSLNAYGMTVNNNGSGGTATIYGKNSGSGRLLDLRNNEAGAAGLKFNVENDGSATFSGTVTATVVPPSDVKFKENITPANPQLADVVALGGLLKNYDWNDDAPVNEELRKQRQLGLIAQEAETVCPGLVKTIARTKQGKELTPEVVVPAVYREVPDSDNDGKTIKELVTPEQVTEATYEELDDSYKGLSTDVIIMKLLGAVAELKAEVEASAALEARLYTALQTALTRIEALETEVQSLKEGN